MLKWSVVTVQFLHFSSTQYTFLNVTNLVSRIWYLPIIKKNTIENDILDHWSLKHGDCVRWPHRTRPETTLETLQVKEECKEAANSYQWQTLLSSEVSQKLKLVHRSWKWTQWLRAEWVRDPGLISNAYKVSHNSL